MTMIDVNLWKFIQSFLTTRPNYDLSKLDRTFNRSGEASELDRNWKSLMDSSKQWKEVKKQTIYLYLNRKSCLKYLQGNEDFKNSVDETIISPIIQLGFSHLSSSTVSTSLVNFGFFSSLSESDILNFRNICLNGTMSFDYMLIPTETLSLELEYFGTRFLRQGVDNEARFYNTALLFQSADTLQRLSLSFSGPLEKLKGFHFPNLRELILVCVTEVDPELEESSIEGSFWDTTTFPKLEKLEISWLDNLSCHNILKLTNGGLFLKEIKLSQYSLLTEEELSLFKNIPIVSIISCDVVTDIHCLINIQKLEFHDNVTLSSFHCENFPFLHEVILSSCDRLMEFTITGVSLKKVTLSDCSQLVTIYCQRNLIFLYVIFCKKVKEINLSKDVNIGVLDIIQPNDLIFPDIIINLSENSKIRYIEKKNECIVPTYAGIFFCNFK
jgi:hypothetical protein